MIIGIFVVPMALEALVLWLVGIADASIVTWTFVGINTLLQLFTLSLIAHMVRT